MADRAALITILAADFGPLFDELGMTATEDSLTVYLDAVEGVYARRPDLSPDWGAPLARYYLLDGMLTRLATYFNVSLDGESYSLQQVFANVLKLRDLWYSRVKWLVDPDGEADGAGGAPFGAMFTVRSEHLKEGICE